MSNLPPFDRRLSRIVDQFTRILELLDEAQKLSAGDRHTWLKRCVENQEPDFNPYREIGVISTTRQGKRSKRSKARRFVVSTCDFSPFGWE